jgi:hypothetical protein
MGYAVARTNQPRPIVGSCSSYSLAVFSHGRHGLGSIPPLEILIVQVAQAMGRVILGPCFPGTPCFSKQLPNKTPLLPRWM